MTKYSPNFPQFQISEEKDVRLVFLSVLNSFKKSAVHTYLEKFDNAASLLRLGLPSTLFKPKVFENAGFAL